MEDKDFFQDVSGALNEGQEQKTEDAKVEGTQQEDIKEEINKIKVGADEYSQEELSQLVGLGKIAKDVEVKYNTKIDKVWPEYTRTTQELKEAKEELSRIKSGVTESGELDPNALAQAREAAKKIGIVTQDDFDTYMAKSFRTYYMNERAAERLIEGTEDVIAENSDKGLPKTSVEDVLKHMQETGIKSPEKAYKDMFEKEIDSWKQEQVSRAKRPGLVTSTTGSGVKSPPSVRPTRDNLDQLVSEALYGGKE